MTTILLPHACEVFGCFNMVEADNKPICDEHLASTVYVSGYSWAKKHQNLLCAVAFLRRLDNDQNPLYGVHLIRHGAPTTSPNWRFPLTSGTVCLAGEQEALKEMGKHGKFDNKFSFNEIGEPLREYIYQQVLPCGAPTHKGNYEFEQRVWVWTINDPKAIYRVLTNEEFK